MQRLGNLSEIRDHGGWLADGIILPEGNKIIMFSSHQLADVFRSPGQSIIGGYGNQNRPPVPQVTFCGHGHRPIRDTVSQLCQGIAGAGGNDQGIQKLFGPDGLCLGDS